MGAGTELDEMGHLVGRWGNGTTVLSFVRARWCGSARVAAAGGSAAEKDGRVCDAEVITSDGWVIDV